MGLWSKIKKIARKVWRAVKAIVRIVVKIVVEIVSRVVNIVLGLVLFWVRKKIRIVVLILRDEVGNALIDQDETKKPNDPNLIALKAAIDYATNTFKDEMDIDIKPYGTLIQTLKNSAPTAALGVKCDMEFGALGTGIGGVAGAVVGGVLGFLIGGPWGSLIGASAGGGLGALLGAKDGGALSNEFGEAGEYFARHTAGWGWGRMNLYFPITIFIVRDVTGKLGCSLGPLTDYVTVSLKGTASDSTLAHELGHCCGLLHRKDQLFGKDQPDNLMWPDDPRGNNITGWQKRVVRTSRHCTFW